MTTFTSRFYRLAVPAGMFLLTATTTTHAALSSSKGTGEEPSGMLWLYFAAFILGTLGIAFMPSKRKEAE